MCETHLGGFTQSERVPLGTLRVSALPPIGSLIEIPDAIAVDPSHRTTGPHEAILRVDKITFRATEARKDSKFYTEGEIWRDSVIFIEVK